jgi:hypothetical protein
LTSPDDPEPPWREDDDGSGGEAASDAPSSPGELAYHGTIAHFARGTGSGVVRTASGREIPFELEHVVVAESLVPAPGRIAIEVGQAIGYDVGWTSRGLRVTKLFPVS